MQWLSWTWPWLFIALLGAVFVRRAWSNAKAVASIHAKAPPLRPLVGGVAGSVACLLCPIEDIAALFWLPLLLDVGCLPQQLLVAFGLLRASAHAPAMIPASAAERAGAGSLVGSAVADAIGLPWEGLSRRRLQRLQAIPLRHRLLFGRGMGSDDSEHACMCAQALLTCGGHPATFARELGYRLRWWLLALPAGVGLATLRSIIRLWLGFPPARSGVNSAGNGAAMRAPILGVCFGADWPRLQSLLHASTVLTHRDIRAEHGSWVVALAAGQSADHRQPINAEAFQRCLQHHLPADSPLLPVMTKVIRSVQAGESTLQLAERIGCGRAVSGFVLHTVPVVIHAWLRYPEDYRAAITSVVELGGDTDSVASILGGIVGARVGVEGIPLAWRKGWIDWPRSLPHIEALGARAALAARDGLVEPELPLLLLAIPLRNALFLVVVLLHGLRRLLPPYG